MHRRGILHRDMKPENVLVMDGQVRILDFGLATRRSEVSSIGSGGSMLYYAPELWDQLEASPSSDLYALGVMSFEMLAGQHPFAPFDDDFSDRVFEAEYDLSLLKVTSALANVVDRLLAKAPKARYQRAQDVLEALDTALGTTAIDSNTNIRESYLLAARFVGRKTELEQLSKALGQAVSGQSSIWLIGGESGVGKTRLTDEVRIQALLKGLAVMRGQGVDGGGLPFQLWGEPVRRLLLIQSEVPDLQAGILKDIVPDIEVLLDREVKQAPQLYGPGYQQRMILSIIDLFRNLAEPVLIVLEDLQWTSESLEV
ncbi:MAG: AAA family ATPase [Gammaproteobacteria bacterium]|nr:AAA family ATPase [Gammaproteobacteria bacterium]